MKTRNSSQTPNWLVWLSHVVVPLVFFSLARWSVREREEITWPLLVTMCVGSLPFVFVLLTRYVKKLKIGDTEYDFAESEEIPKEVVAELAKNTSADRAAAAAKISPEAETKFGELSRPARKVLRTLSTFQRRQFGADSGDRWGFHIQPSAPDYVHFRIGATELRNLGLTMEDKLGMVFLSDFGMEFCNKRETKNAIDGGGDMWSKFGGA